MSAAARIQELQRMVVDTVMERDKSSDDWKAAEMMMKLTGSTVADIVEQELKNPWTMIAAIMTYLEERDK